MGPKKISPAQSRYIRRAVALREKLNDKALARKFGVSESAIQYHAHRRPVRR